MSFVLGLRCRSCAVDVEPSAIAACPACGAQLDPAYNWNAIARAVDRDALARRPRTLWRYRELLPLDDAPRVSLATGGTPLVDAPALADAIGVGRVWLKLDAFSFPSLSFKDRVVAVAVNKALELGIETVGCPSTGNLANAVAAHAAQAGIESWIFIPHDIEAGKVAGTAVHRPRLVRVCGTYDQINRLTHEAAERFGWGIVNVNLRAYYGEGSKTLAFEIAEERGWRLPTAVVAPMAGGLLVTKLHTGFRELDRLGWVAGARPRVFGAQAAGCAPIAAAVLAGTEAVTPVVPETIAKSIAIGDPVDGPWAVRAIRESGGWAAAVDDDEVIAGIRLLAERAGVFTETAGGVTTSAARRLAAEGRLTPDDEVVLCITGNGFKTIEALEGAFDDAPLIEPDLAALERLVA